ncbi:hypothetical protein L596_001281 [Steinernema carpocapsae]|uniref:Golgi apparatus protein 1 n=1 Tax=Steinernema carpocapsae TaxID=34508 RepID=A0A4U8UL09_STECR|nr:hypothetical protein L596_001281 [Steinernema carpocapsae]
MQQNGRFAKKKWSNGFTRSLEIEHVERVAFADFRLIGPFVHKCGNVVTQLGCGQLTTPSKHNQVRVPHSQGSVLECLIDRLVKNPQMHADALKSMDDDCRHEVMRLVELQSDDFHLDRHLFFACREDREKFCGEVPAGNGKVFECLLSHKDEPNMHPECRNVTNDRAQRMGEDYRMAPPLVKACGNEMKHYQCIPQTDMRGSPNFHLSWVLLCLENAVHVITQRKQGQPVDKPFSEGCQHEMIAHRQMMVEEFRMSPELVMNCAQEIHNYCSPNGDIERSGATMHCLMSHAQERDEKRQLGPQCMTALSTLVKVADLGSNYKVDKVLYESCKQLIDTSCNQDAVSEAATLNCLMQHVDSADMNRQCEQRLLEVQYFMARDWTLDPELYKACQKDAQERCHAQDNWWMKDNRQHIPDSGPTVLACLYRNAYDDQHPLEQDCAMNVRRVLHTRAIRVNLMPEVEENCRGALSEYCSRKTDVPQAEMQCLQENFETEDFKKRHEKCYQAVTEFTKMQSKDIQLNHALTKACRPVIQTYCDHFINEDIDHGDVMECLYRNKETQQMTPKCRSYVHHFELISMRDYHFSYRFTQACQNDIQKYCRNYGNDKGSIIRCLSEIQFEHRVLSSEKDLQKECKKQLRVAYLQQEQVNFDDKKHMNDADPILMKKCESEVRNLQCMEKSKSFEDVVECLREGFEKLGPECKSMIFNREKVELVDNSLDDELQRLCKHDIDKYCPKQNEDGGNVLECLANSKIVRLLKKPCFKIVKVRMQEQARDIRLRPGLLQACREDARQHCPQDFNKISDPKYQQTVLEGVIVGCLREKFSQMRGQIHLAANCKAEISKVIVESELDIELDRPLYESCKSTIEHHCRDKVIESGGSFETVLDCLKNDFYTGAISDQNCAKEVARRTRESLVDIQLDPVLQDACSLDLKRYCSDVPAGQSRQITCLMDVLEVNRVKMEENCKSKLIDRKRLWNYAHEKFSMQLPESWQEMYSIIANHPQRTSLLTYIGLVILALFVLGCCLGRCTKRTHYELKNR